MAVIHYDKKHSASVGVGLRPPHFYDFLESEPDIQFVEVHAENYYMDGGPALDMLLAVRARMDVSIHATSLGLGSEGQLPGDEIGKLKKLVDAIDPVLISDHACFSWCSGIDGLLHSGDLLPIQYTEKSLDRFCNNVDRVQQALGRQILVENLSVYLSLSDSTMSELEFLQRVCMRTGAGLLLDVNNIFVNVSNAGSDDVVTAMSQIIADIEPDFVQEIHLAGASRPANDELMIDDHSTVPTHAVWQAYSELLATIGPRYSLIEWDTQLPAWDVLVEQARKAFEILDRVGGHHG